MTTPQILVFVILGGMLTLFVWDRLRYDLVAVLALLASVFCGVVPADRAFSGFGNSVLPLIAGALAVSAAVGKSGLVEVMIRRLEPLLTSRDLQVGVLVALVTVLSAFMKNIGALAIFLPVALELAQRSKRSGSEMLMPLAFGSLIGGLATLIGTSPNILISGIRADLVGAPFSMFDFTPVGGPIAVCGIVFLSFGWRLLPRGRQPRQSAESRFTIEAYTSEASVPEGSPMIGRTVAELEALGEGELTVSAVIRDGRRSAAPTARWTLSEGDVLVIESDPHLLASVVDRAKLELVGSKDIPSAGDDAGKTEARVGEDKAVGAVEAVITADSPMIGLTSGQLALRQRHGINLLAVSRSGRRSSARLHRVRFRAGDVVVLQGDLEAMPETLARLGCLPLAERNLRLGQPRQIIIPLAILAAALIGSAVEIVPAEIVFVAATALLALCGVLTLREIYQSIEWPILILLGALIPVGEAVRHTGASDVVAGWISLASSGLPPFGVLAVVMIVTMLATPVLHHAAAVIVMGPVAASLAKKLGFNVDPFLMAVAVGAGSDFLSPIGHQCNTLVLGPGGYRFGDYWRLGLPLSTIVVVVGVPLIMVFWPLH